ncbi:MAG: Amylo-alpha-1,6-glucosidase [Candidatus Wolfebacteria bacterium GW2011_GWC1_43_10]|uniref:Amylo-alpha-1,6-glucosidase n=2 Tax=Candidatus Wolfeibacteriota TaxID=1752735 RepID=A0A0G1CB94_9BACT|nr:MAG: Amylo-alpha-1,6-glucosidase [Candidatus Wolfebacteria bacterium GW2011_GWC1_43_10]
MSMKNFTMNSAQNKIAIKNIKPKLEENIEILRDPELGYIRAGLPRFAALFGRDSCIVSWQLIDYDATIARRTIELLAELQGKKINNASEEEPGKIIHEWHPNPSEYKSLQWPLPYYGSVDSTPLFIYLYGLYYEKSVDTEWLAKYWPHIVSALEWCENYGDFDGDALLEYERKNPAGLLHQGWKDSRMDHLGLKPPVELIEAQGYYYAALREAAELALMLKNEFLEKKLNARAKKLKEAVIKEFWLPEKNLFAFALSESKFPDERVSSNPGHLLFSGVLDDEDDKIKAVVDRLFQKDMWTPYGIRTHAESNPDFNPMSYHLGSIWPHDNWIIAQGLKKYGYVREYKKVKMALLDAYQAIGEIPELYAVIEGKIEKIPVACSPQAWASGALLNFILEK